LRPDGCCSAMPWLLQVLLRFLKKKGFCDVAKVANRSLFFNAKFRENGNFSKKKKRDIILSLYFPFAVKPSQKF
jgi:hypothetical protein